jgi:hypothetical protein
VGIKRQISSTSWVSLTLKSLVLPNATRFIDATVQRLIEQLTTKAFVPFHPVVFWGCIALSAEGYMEPLSFGPKHWRGRAATARAVAEQLAHPESKQRMLVIAEEYEKLASGS